MKECHFLPPKNKSHDGEIFQCGKLEFLLEIFWRDTCQTVKPSQGNTNFSKNLKNDLSLENAVFFSSSFTDPTRPVEYEQENERDKKNKSKSWLTSGELCVYIYHIYIYIFIQTHDICIMI